MRNRNPSLTIALLALLALAVAPAWAQTPSDRLTLNILGTYSPPNLDGYGSSGVTPIDFSIIDAADSDKRALGNGWGGAAVKASLTYAYTLPVLTGGGPFFSGNNLKLAGSAELTPVTLEALGSATLTPIAFLQFQTGASIGTGWSMGFIGLALNPADSSEGLEEIPLGGAILNAWASGTFQFDLAAVLPGAWNHVVMQATAKFEYRDNTAADEGEAWVWQLDDMNFDGWRYLGTYLLGYQMPAAINMVAVMLETQEYLGSVRDYGTMASGGWGSDFVTLIINPLANIALGDRDNLTIIAQIRSTQDWTDASTQERSFQQRVYEGRQFYLDHIAVSYTRTLK